MELKRYLTLKNIGIAAVILAILLVVKGYPDYGAPVLITGLIILYFGGQLPIPKLEN